MPYLSAKVPQMSRDDIVNTKDTYNKLKYTDANIPGGRHFFWAMGKRWLRRADQRISLPSS